MQKLMAKIPSALVARMSASVKPCNFDNWVKYATANPDITWYK